MDENKQQTSAPLPPTNGQVPNDGSHIIVGSDTGIQSSPLGQLHAPVASKHTFAKTYLIISLIVLLMCTVLPIAFVSSVADQPGSEFLVFFLIPVFIVAGLFGVANLFVLPRFLARRYFNGPFKALTIGLLIFSVLAAILGALMVAGVFRSVSSFKDHEHESQKITQYYTQSEATARSDATVEQVTTLLNDCKVIGLYYTKQDGTDGAENAEKTSTGILLYHVPKSYSGTTTPASNTNDEYRVHLADRMVSTLVPIARNAQHTCGIQFWHDGNYEQWKAGHWYFNDQLVV